MRTPAQVKKARERLAFMRKKREERSVAEESFRLMKQRFDEEAKQCDEAFDEENDPYIHRDQFNAKGRRQLIALISFFAFIVWIHCIAVTR